MVRKSVVVMLLAFMFFADPGYAASVRRARDRGETPSLSHTSFYLHAIGEVRHREEIDRLVERSRSEGGLDTARVPTPVDIDAAMRPAA